MVSVFPRFELLSIDHKPYINSLTENFPPYSDFNFISLWSWNTENKFQISVLNDNLVVLLSDYINRKPFLTFLGRNKTKNTIENLLHYAKNQQLNSDLRMVPESSIENDKTNLEKYFKIVEDVDNADYIVSVDHMIQLLGKEYFNIRRQIHKFNKLYPDHTLRLLDINQNSTQVEIMDLFYRWVEVRNKTLEESEHEKIAFEKLFEISKYNSTINFGLYVKDKLIGIHICEPLYNKYYIAHYGKTDITYIGAFKYMVTQAAHIMKEKGFLFANFEQDLGVPGLRFSKNIFKPSSFLKKFTISNLT